MLFHAGALWRLSELAWLPRIDFVSSVSGGSIAAGVLAAAWKRLKFRQSGTAENFETVVVAPLRDLASRTIDRRAIILGALLPGSSAATIIEHALAKYAVGSHCISTLPDRPRFIINATSLQSGSSWRFSKPYMRDYRVGSVETPIVPLARAVAASAAFPPFLSPASLYIARDAWTSIETGTFEVPPSHLVLTDGGVYDNLGLDSIIRRCSVILVSDGGGQMRPQLHVARDWPRQLLRVLSVVDNQVRNLRKRMLIDGYESKRYSGCYWGMRTNISAYKTEKCLPVPIDQTRSLAQIPTRLRHLPDLLQDKLINWGYSVCDAAMRRWVCPDALPPDNFPYPASAV